MLVERLGPEKIKIDRPPVSQMKGDSSSPIEDKTEMRRSREIIPDLLLRNRQDVKLRIKALRHDGTF
jgi:hypothetical protein